MNYFSYKTKVELDSAVNGFASLPQENIAYSVVDKITRLHIKNNAGSYALVQLLISNDNHLILGSDGAFYILEK